MALDRKLLVLPAVFLVLGAACSSFAVSPDAAMDVPPEDAGVDALAAVATADGGWTIAFTDDFDGEVSGWEDVVFGRSDDERIDAGPSGRLFFADDERGRSLRAARDAYPSSIAKSLRLERRAPSTMGRLELSLSIFVPNEPIATNDAGRTQLALLTVPGLALYPVLTTKGFGFSTKGPPDDYRDYPSGVTFASDVWHTMTLAIDTAERKVSATLDGKTALAVDDVIFGTVGAYRVGVGLRTEGPGTAITVRYDDVVVRYR